MTLPFFLDQPTEVTKKTLIADLMTPELTVRALRLGLIRVGDLVRAASENRLVELKLSSEDTEALKKWLEEKGLMKTRKKKAVKKDEKPLPPPNPKIVPLERIMPKGRFKRCAGLPVEIFKNCPQAACTSSGRATVMAYMPFAILALCFTLHESSFICSFYL